MQGTMTVEQRAWDFVSGGFKSFNLSDDRLRVYAGLIAELIQGAIDDDRAALAAAQRVAGETPQGHDEPCYYCGEPCSSIAGNPGLWPIPLCHRDDPGRVKWHHTSCVTDRLIENQPAALALSPGKVEGWREGIKNALRQHWLTGIECDHAAKTDTATCSCALWKSKPMLSVGAAVDAWIDHVMERAEPESFNRG